MKHPFLVILVITAASVTCVAQNIVLGVLEDNRGHYGGDPNHRSVRVVFEKKGNEWLAFPNDCENQACLKTLTSHYPENMTWTITFDGKNVGHVASRTPSDFQWYSDIGQQDIISNTPLPVIGTRSREFGGYGDDLVYRPLIANSQPFFADPDRWKPSTASPDLISALRQAFRKRFPKLCRLSTADQTKLEPFAYRNEEVSLPKAYSSSSGWTVACLHLEAVNCSDVEAGFDIDDPWFVIDVKHSVTYLDSGIWLVDAGDYDNDGKSELVFSINRENEGGYEIYYDSFRKRAIFKFSYH